MNTLTTEGYFNNIYEFYCYKYYYKLNATYKELSSWVIPTKYLVRRLFSITIAFMCLP